MGNLDVFPTCGEMCGSSWGGNRHNRTKADQRQKGRRSMASRTKSHWSPCFIWGLAILPTLSCIWLSCLEGGMAGLVARAVPPPPPCHLLFSIPGLNRKQTNKQELPVLSCTKPCWNAGSVSEIVTEQNFVPWNCTSFPFQREILSIYLLEIQKELPLQYGPFSGLLNMLWFVVVCSNPSVAIFITIPFFFSTCIESERGKVNWCNLIKSQCKCRDCQEISYASDFWHFKKKYWLSFSHLPGAGEWRNFWSNNLLCLYRFTEAFMNIAQSLLTLAAWYVITLFHTETRRANLAFCSKP